MRGTLNIPKLKGEDGMKKMSLLLLVFLVLQMLFSLLLTQTIALNFAEVIFQDGFEDGTVDKWILALYPGEEYVIATTELAYSGSYSAKIIGGGAAYGYAFMYTTISVDSFSWEGFFRIDFDKAIVSTYAIWDGETIETWVEFENGKIYWRYYTSAIEIGSYLEDQWYQIQFAHVQGQSIWTLSIKDENNNVVFESHDLVGSDTVQGIGYAARGVAYVDDVMVMSPWTPLITATVDIDPDTLNLKSNGKFVTAYIELPEGFDVADIVLETVYLDGIQAITDEQYDFVTDPAQYLVDHDEDGILERMVKFDRAEVQNTLTNEPDYDEAPKFYDLTLTVTGELADGTPFEGSDTITVIKK